MAKTSGRNSTHIVVLACNLHVGIGRYMECGGAIRARAYISGSVRYCNTPREIHVQSAPSPSQPEPKYLLR